MFGSKRFLRDGAQLDARNRAQLDARYRALKNSHPQWTPTVS